MKQVFLLDSAGVDSISSLMEEWSEKNGVNNKTIIRLRLTMEEMLIRISKRFNGSKKGTLIIGKRFGKPYFKVRYRGESYDPTKADPGNEWANRMLGKIGLAPMWSYRDGMNEICLYGPARTVRTETRLGIAAILAIVLGLAGAAIPAALTEIIQLNVPNRSGEFHGGAQYLYRPAGFPLCGDRHMLDRDNLRFQQNGEKCSLKCTPEHICGHRTLHAADDSFFSLWDRDCGGRKFTG